MSTVVIDASALVALIRGEPGSEMVQKDVRTATISTVNLGETAQRQFKTGTSRAEFESVIESLELDIIPVDAELAIDAAEIREIGRKVGLSQADCICLALAKRMGTVAMTADRAWREVGESVGVEVRVIR